MFQIEVKGLDNLIRKLEKYADSLEMRKKRFLERLADIGVEVASVRFYDAQYDGSNDVTVERASWVDSNTIAVKATGSSILFIEFGAGIKYPEHPQSGDFGFKHGIYGQGKGANPKGWVYKGEKGTNGMEILIHDKQGKVVGVKSGVYRTFGNPPARAMYEASKEMRENIIKIAREVFL